MNINEIICHIAMFDYKQSIYTRSQSNDIACIRQVTLDELPTAITELCNIYQCSHVHLYGQDEYTRGVARSIKHTYVNEYHYTDNDLIVEVN